MTLKSASMHHVRAGETLGVIARDHGVSVAALILSNPQIHNPNLIRLGEVVHLPKGAHRHPAGHGSAPGHAAAAAAAATSRPIRAAPAPADGPSPAAGVSAAGFAFIYSLEHVDGVSEHLHWPGGSSGVTLGSGYDMRYRTGAQIVRELGSVGVPADQASLAAGGAGKTDDAAKAFARDNHDGIVLTPDQERRLLAINVRDAVATVAQTVKVPLTQHQHDALVSLVFNIGDPHFRGSTVLRRLQDGDYSGAGEAFHMWNKSGGGVSKGLVNRRQAEVAFYNKVDTSGPRAAMPAHTAVAGTPLASTGAAAGGAARFVDIIRRRGNGNATAALDSGKLVIVGIRTATALNANQGKGSYDDVMAIVRKAGAGVEARTFKCNTEPSTQYLHKPGKAPPDANKDGRPDLGQIEAGQTIHYTMGTFLEHPALKVDGGQMIRVRRDINHDNRMDASDPVSSVAGAGGMHIHVGGMANTWSSGCQTLPTDEHARFFATLRRLNPQQREFYYVIVDAPG